MAVCTTPSLTAAIHHSSPPYTITHPNSAQLMGAIPELVTLLAAKAGYSLTISAVPYQRIPIAMNRGTADLGVIYARDQKTISSTLKHFSCLQQPLIKSPTFIYGISKSNKPLPTLAIFALIESRTDVFTINDADYRIEKMSYAGRAFKAVAAHRVDYVLSSETAAHYWSDKLQRNFIKISKANIATILLCTAKNSQANTNNALYDNIAKVMKNISHRDRLAISQKWNLNTLDVLPQPLN